MRISQKGLYALQATCMLSRHYNEGATRIHEIAAEENLPEGFLVMILLELKNARVVECIRGVRGGYRLARPPRQIFLSEIIRRIDAHWPPSGMRSLSAHSSAMMRPTVGFSVYSWMCATQQRESSKARHWPIFLATRVNHQGNKTCQANRV
jgi:Rrf2 family protein